MTRLGPWVLCAGLALLCAGVISSPPLHGNGLDAPKRILALDVAGIDTVELKNVGYGSELIIDDRRAAAISLNMDGKSPVVTRDGHMVKVTFPDDALRTTVTLPPQIRQLRSDKGILNVVAAVRVESMRIDSDAFVTWSGDAGTLELRDSMLAATPTDACNAGAGQVHFLAGRVDALRIVTARRDVRLGDLSRVGDIAIEVGPKVGLSLDRGIDAGKLQIVPLAVPASANAKDKCAPGVAEVEHDMLD